MSKETDALAYLRVSGAGQIDGDGFPRQRDAINAYAAANGITVVAEYRDEGISGTTDFEDRPGIAAILAHIESNGVRTVIVENASRLARQLMVQEVILEQFRRLGVRVIDASTGYDMAAHDDNDPTRTLIRQVLGAIMQFEKSMLVLKLRAARERARKSQGRCEGIIRYGHDTNRPEEKAGLKFMLELWKKSPDITVHQLAECMNGSIYRPRMAKLWSVRMLRFIIHHEIGKFPVRRKVRRGKKKPQNENAVPG